MDLHKEIELLERQFADPEARKDISRLGEMLSDDFEEYSSSGRVIGKRDVLDWLAVADPVQYDLSEFTFKTLSDTCILVKYISSIAGKRAFRSSIWIKENSGWKMLHHQATPLPDHT